MRKVSLALASVLVSLVLVGSVAYGASWFGLASAASPAAPSAQEGEEDDDGDEAESAHAWLGILGMDNNEHRAQQLGLSTTEGVIVVQVIGEPAESAGLQRGDVITAVDGTAIANLGDLRETLNGYSPGDVVTVTYIRDGVSQTIQVTLGERPQRLGHYRRPGLAPLPDTAKMVMRLLGGPPLERLISSTTVFEGEDGAEITVQAIGGTVTAIQPATETEPGALTVQPKDGSAEVTITIEEGVLLLKQLRPVDLSRVQVGDRVIIVRVLKDGELQKTVILVGTVTFGPAGGTWGPGAHQFEGRAPHGLPLGGPQIGQGYPQGLDRLGQLLGDHEQLREKLSDQVRQFQEQMKEKRVEAQRATSGVSF